MTEQAADHGTGMIAPQLPTLSSGGPDTDLIRQRLAGAEFDVHCNAADIETRYLLITTPKISEPIAVLHDPERRSGRGTETVFADYDSRIVD